MNWSKFRPAGGELLEYIGIESYDYSVSGVQPLKLEPWTSGVRGRHRDILSVERDSLRAIS